MLIVRNSCYLGLSQYNAVGSVVRDFHPDQFSVVRLKVAMPVVCFNQQQSSLWFDQGCAQSASKITVKIGEFPKRYPVTVVSCVQTS